MPKLTQAHGVRTMMSLVAVLTTLCAAACSGTDRLTDPVVSEAGSYFASLGGNPGSANTDSSPRGGNTSTGTGLGGAPGGSAAPASGGSESSTPSGSSFDWSASQYDANGGANVDYQSHFNGMACVASCHNHTLNVGGTLYQSGGTNPAANAQIGVLVNGQLSTTYSGSKGNFYVTISGTIDWTTAQIAVRTSKGSSAMPANSDATGNCNSCHNSGNRITVP